jgi:hypothetical protein
MTRLNLSPLPSFRRDEASAASIRDREGFVDDSVVFALVAGPSVSRPMPEPAHLALSTDDTDFAGWRLSPFQRLGQTERNDTLRDERAQRAAPPTLDEPGLGEPHRGEHRWWLAGLAGVLSTLLFSVLLLSLSARLPEFPANGFMLRTPILPEETAPHPEQPDRKSAPHFTEASP